MTPMPARASRWQDAAHAPGVVAVIGASENPDKVGGRPIRYMQRFGFAGRILPVNPTRREVQGLPAFPHLADLPARPDLAIIAVPAAAARDAVDACAAAGVGVAVVLTSGFGETGGEGRRLQQEMVATARTAGMRLIGPNTQGIANFGNGTIASFATLFGEIAPADGPVAIVSQSGAMSVVPYAHLRRQGIGVRYAHATGNEADVTAADLAFGVLEDPKIRLLLLYLEHLEDPETLAQVAARAHARNIPVLALKAGRSARGAAAAQSHTGALAGEDRVVDAFLRRVGILRVDDMHDLIDAAELFLTVRRRPGHRLLVVSNSGASCVLAADRAESEGLTLPPLPTATRAQLAEVLPPFATADNPLDLTGALLSQSAMLGQALAALAAHDIADHLLLALPNAGTGYDLAGFAAATAVWRAQTGGAAAVSTPNPAAAAVFRAAGLATFDHDGHAVAALGRLARWGALQAARTPDAPVRADPIALPEPLREPPAGERHASELVSLRALAACGLPTPRMALCRSAQEARAAAATLRAPLVAKGSSPDVPHKSEHGLVRLGLRTPEDAQAASADLLQRLTALGVRSDGVLLAEMAPADLELILGARRVARFGVVVTVGAGGKFVEALDDVAVLIAPFSQATAEAALASLRIAPLLAALRGEPAIDTGAIAALMQRFAEVMTAASPAVVAIDLNPVLAARGGGLVIADALIEYAQGTD